MISQRLRQAGTRALAGICSRARRVRRYRPATWHAVVVLGVSAVLLIGVAAALQPAVPLDAVASASSANLGAPHGESEMGHPLEAGPPVLRPAQSAIEAPQLPPAPAAVADPLAHIEWAPSPNYSRRSAKVDTVVLHTTEDTLLGALRWFQSTASKASSHYMVGRDGRILLVVREDQAAYHAGVVSSKPGTRWYGTNPNQYSIGIEMESLKSFKTPADMTDAQRQAVFALVRDIVIRYNIPIDRQHIVAHAEINPGNRTDPGPGFPWDDLMAYLKAGG